METNNKNNSDMQLRSNVMFIQESIPLAADYKVTQEGSEYYIEGIYVKSDIPNGNDRIYPKEYLTNAVALYNRDFISKRKSIGEQDHPIPQRTDPILSKRAVLTEVLEMQSDGTVFGRSRVLKNSVYGADMINVINDGIAFGTSFRAYAEVKEGTDGYVYCGPQILFRAFDAVLIPSVGEDVSSVQESMKYNDMYSMDQFGELQSISESHIADIKKDKYTLTNGVLIKDSKANTSIDLASLRNAFR